MIKQLSSTSSYSSPKNGFLLLELCLALVMALLLAMLLCRTALPLLHSWPRLLREQQLCQAQSYMFNMLEYEIAQNGSKLNISSDGQQLTCKSIYEQKSLSYSRECLNQHYGLYVTIKNAKGSSKNPLFIPGCDLYAWNVTALSSNQLLIELILVSGDYRRSYRRVFQLLNGRIENAY